MAPCLSDCVIINRECYDLQLQIDLPTKKKHTEILANTIEQIKKWPTIPSQGKGKQHSRLERALNSREVTDSATNRQLSPICPMKALN